MFSYSRTLIDALWILGLVGLVITLAYANLYRSRRGWHFGHAFNVPRILLPLCLSLTTFCVGLTLNGLTSYQIAPWWEIVAWGLLMLLFATQTVIYGLAGNQRGFDTLLDQNRTLNQNELSNQNTLLDQSAILDPNTILEQDTTVDPYRRSEANNTSERSTMSDPQNTLDNWQLKEARGRTLNKWQLREAGPEALGYLQLLQENASAADWQPVEYTRGQTSRPNWILPSVVGLVLVAVSGYLIWLGINRLGGNSIPSSVANAPISEVATNGVETGNGQENPQVPAATDGGAADSGQAEPSNDGGQSAVAVQPVVEAPTPLPTPEPVIEPEPVVEAESILIERTIATIIHQYGVNLRDAPNTDSEVIQLLEEGEVTVVIDQPNGDWIQVELEDGDKTGWVSSEFVELQSDSIPATPAQIEALKAAAAAEIQEAAAEETAVEETPAEEAGGEAAGGVEESTTVETIGAVSATISTPAGLNARAEPNADSEVVILLENGKTLDIVSQSDDELWVEIALDDGDTAWLFAEFVTVKGDLASLNTQPAIADEPVEEVASDTPAPDAPATEDSAEDAIAEEPVEEVIEEVAEEIVELLTTDGDPPPEPFTNVIPAGASVAVENEYGVNARSTASLDGEVALVVPQGAALQIVGKSDNDEWVQVVLPNNTLAWIFAQTVKTVSIDGVSVVEPPAVGAPLEIYEPPVEETVEPATEESSAEAEPATDEAVAEESQEPPAEATDTEVAADATDEADTSSTPAVQLVFTTTVPDGPAVVVDSIVGINARTEPNAEDSQTIIERVPNGVALSATGRTENNDWVQVVLPDNTTAWIFTQAVKLENVALDELPVVEIP